MYKNYKIHTLIMKNSLIAFLFAIWTAFSGFAQAAEDITPIPNISDAWRFEVTPYLWAPGIKGTVGLDSGPTKSADFTTSNVLGI